MKSRDIDILVRQFFEGRGWRWESVSALPSSLVLDSIVTPFFSTRTIGRGKGVCMIQGYMGVLHRGFESNWTFMKTERDGVIFENKFSIILNTQNINSLYDLSYIESLEDDLMQFCNKSCEILDMFPKTPISLREIFVQNKIANIDLEKFVGLGQREKFESFKIFMNNLS
jgi:hypothetical protein